MSAKQTGLVWELNLPQNEAWVLMAMADHADHDGNNLYPGVPRLAWKTGYTTRQIRRILAILQAKGLIVVEEEGGGRKTTRYRLDLAGADRKDPHRPEYARSGRAESVQVSEAKEDKMSPLPSAAPEERMSPQPGQNVMAARTQLCHPNRQGREGKEPSIPPPSASSPHQRPATAAGATPNSENSEGGENSADDQRGAGEAPRASSSSAEAVWRAWARWAGREELPADRRRSFDRQAERLVSGHDLGARTQPSNRAILSAGDRPGIFNLLLQYLEGMTSRTLRGGVMYALTKGSRTPPSVAGQSMPPSLRAGRLARVSAATARRTGPPPSPQRRRPFNGRRSLPVAPRSMSERARSRNMTAGTAMAAERGGRRAGEGSVSSFQRFSRVLSLAMLLQFQRVTGGPVVTRSRQVASSRTRKLPPPFPASRLNGQYLAFSDIGTA